MQHSSQDRVGLGWRPELAAGIFSHRGQIDVVEIIAEDWFDATRHKVSALRTLATQIPVQLHGTSAGLAGAELVEEKRLAKMARLVDLIQPEVWSEHLAFVRAAGHEIGHLAAVPRNSSTVADTAQNIDRARRIVGITPMVENIATLIAPPASPMNESEWLSDVVAAADAPLLLDLHNLYANSINFGSDEAKAPMDALRRLPLHRVTTVHIAGGAWTRAEQRSGAEKRWLDDHLHPVPDAVFSLLEELAALAPQPLTVILERDGAYPSIGVLLAELQLAKAALSRGRSRRQFPVIVRDEKPPRVPDAPLNYARLEATLASIYLDESLRMSLLENPERFSNSRNLALEDSAALASIDQTGLMMAARSFARKRALKNKRPH